MNDEYREKKFRYMSGRARQSMVATNRLGFSSGAHGVTRPTGSQRGGAHGVRALPESFCKVITTDEPMNADGGREGRLTVRTSNIQQPTLNKRSPIEKRQRTAAVQDAGALAEAPRVFLNI